MKKLLLLPLLCLLAFLLGARQTSINTLSHPVNDTPHLKQYWLVMLFKGQSRNQDSISSEKIQQAHLANIRRLHEEGFLVMAGPMGYDRDLRGIFILDAKDSLAAASLVNTDPAIRAGRLRFELHPWWTQTGTYQFK